MPQTNKHKNLNHIVRTAFMCVWTDRGSTVSSTFGTIKKRRILIAFVAEKKIKRKRRQGFGKVKMAARDPFTKRVCGWRVGAGQASQARRVAMRIQVLG